MTRAQASLLLLPTQEHHKRPWSLAIALSRCAQDLVELPSHLFEQWAAHPSSLRVLARHHSTQERLPLDACQAIGRHRRSFAGLELQQQLLLSLADQRLFGDAPVGAGGTSLAWAEATTPYSSLPFVKGELFFGCVVVIAALLKVRKVAEVWPRHDACA